MLITNLIPALGWTLLHSLWQGGLLFLVTAPLLLLLNKQRPQLRYGIACGALLILVAAMTVTFITQLEVNPVVPSSSHLAETLVGADHEVAYVTTGVGEATIEPAGASSAISGQFSFIRFWESSVFYLVLLWGLGVLFFTLRWCSMLVATYRMRRSGALELPPVWQQRLKALQRRIGVKEQVILVESDRVDTPLVIGVLKPMILLPIGLVNGLSVQQVEAILAHELAHINRRDFLINLLFTSLEVVLFYHPFYWWVMHRINEERELCCDDAAVAACGNPRMYAYTLLSVEEHRQSEVFALAFSSQGGQLQNRIKRICRVVPQGQQAVGLRFWLLLPLWCGIAAVTYAGVMPGETNEQAAVQLEAAEVVSTLSETEPKRPSSVAVITPAETDQPAPQIASTTTVSAGSKVAVNPIPSTYYAVATPITAPDSLPQPRIPAFNEMPVLPEPPVFTLTEAETKRLLDAGDAGRQQLRDATKAYRDKINQWNARVSDDYLAAWGGHRERILEAYVAWSKDLQQQTGDELAYALAHEDMIQAYERAFLEQEKALSATEKTISTKPEFDTESLERIIERGEQSIAEHSDRMEVHSIRMGMHSVRMQIHSARMRVHSARMKMHSTRMKLHGKRMESHQVIMAALEADLREALAADGYLKSGEGDFKFRVTSSSITFNGKTIEPKALEEKYRKILARYGKADFRENRGNTFMIEIDNRGRKMESNH